MSLIHEHALKELRETSSVSSQVTSHGTHHLQIFHSYDPKNVYDRYIEDSIRYLKPNPFRKAGSLKISSNKVDGDYYGGGGDCCWNKEDSYGGRRWFSGLGMWFPGVREREK